MSHLFKRDDSIRGPSRVDEKLNFHNVYDPPLPIQYPVTPESYYKFNMIRRLKRQGIYKGDNSL
jgi:hypothetical protein